MKESDFDWDDLGSHDGLGDPLQPDLRRMAVAVGFDEAEAANMLVSLGTSRSGTPVFSPGNLKRIKKDWSCLHRTSEQSVRFVGRAFE